MAADAKWSLKGDYLEACSCDAGCPCKFGAQPTKGHCHGILAFEIKEGTYGKVDLGGLGFAGMIKAPSAPWEGNITGTFYVDEKATDEQRQALGTILSGDAGGFWAVIATFVTDNRGVKFAPVKMETNGDTRSFTIPGVLEVSNEPLVNPITKQQHEVMVTNSMDPFCVSGRAGRSSKAVCTDPDVELDLTGQQGYIGTFAWAGP